MSPPAGALPVLDQLEQEVEQAVAEPSPATSATSGGSAPAASVGEAATPAAAPGTAAPPATSAGVAPESATTAPVSAALREMGITGGPGTGVAGAWWKGMKDAAKALVSPEPPAKPQTQAQQAVTTLRNVQTLVQSIFAAVALPKDMLDVGFANLTAPLAAVFPSFPAATLGMMYVGMPHAHSHPPSFIPPAPPVPLPSIGVITLGTSVRVLINGMPAARCGDIGLALTCVGFFPFFQIKTGSSNTFIGGNRAARMLDICQVCSQAEDRKVDGGKFLNMLGSAARGAQEALKYGGMGSSALGVAADTAEAVTAEEPAMQSAKALAAAMGAAQMAADIAAAALTKCMGKDPGIPPGAMGAVILGHPNVLIGGFPMINIPNPIDMILGKLARYQRKAPEKKKPGHCGKPECDD